MEHEARVSVLRFAVRLMQLGVLLLFGLLFSLLARLSCGPQWFLRTGGVHLIRGWMRSVAAVVGLRVHYHSVPAEGPVLYCANHVSWLDIIAMGAHLPVRFVAKQEVKGWPVFGWLAGTAGTVFLKRHSLDGLRGFVDQLRECLDKDGVCLVFPEGTSTDGRSVGRFFPALYQAAVDSGSAVQAVAIRYGGEGQTDLVAPFIDDQGLLGHLLRILWRRETRAEIVFCPPVEAVGRSRQVLARYTREQIAVHLGAPVGASAG